MAVIGKNILDNLTTGMYSDSKVIFREYIQNSCDQIDLAIQNGLIKEDDAAIEIFISPEDRKISIRDNATGVSKTNFKSSLGNIADSDKSIKRNKGFRGIGRLCGLAYCRTLIFRTSFCGEKIMSVMTCDAEKMRKMLQEEKKYSLDDVWDAIVFYSEEKAEEEAHFFEVELIDVNHEDTELLDEEKIKEYLSFVAPVAYKNYFFMSSNIYDHANSLGYKIDEYQIRINGAFVFKNYATHLKEMVGNEKRNYDDITSLEFKDFYDPNTKELIAWMWYGLSRFEKQIPKCNAMRGLRVRCGNIQIGNDDVLKNLFKEQRGNYYYVGEVFVVDKRLIPNSQRDYFNQNETRALFEALLQEYFYNELYDLYYGASRIKSALKRQVDYVKKVEEFNSSTVNGLFVNKDEREQKKIEVEKARVEAEKAKKDLDRLTFKHEENSPMMKVKTEIERKVDIREIEQKTNNVPVSDGESGSIYITSKMNLARKERKLVSRILSIITDNAPKDVADIIIAKIKEEFR